MQLPTAILKDATFQILDDKRWNKKSLQWLAILEWCIKYCDDLSRWGAPEPGLQRILYKRILHLHFDNYNLFNDKYRPEEKVNVPFGQFITMNELDDCGAMGGSTIESIQFWPAERYKEYIDKAADYILHKQVRLEDGTLVRKFPHKIYFVGGWSLHEHFFFSAHGELTHDRKYFWRCCQAGNQLSQYLSIRMPDWCITPGIPI